MPKPVNWELIEYSEQEYRMLGDIISKFHNIKLKNEDGEEYSAKNDMGEPHILLMWRHNVKMDQDDYVLLADITKSPDKIRELLPHDFIIGINKDAWSILDEQQKTVVLDAQLERIAICLDKDDNPKEDEKSRIIYRLRRQEVLDDHTIMRRHNLTLNDVQEFVRRKFTNLGAEEGSYVAEVANS